MSLTAAASGFVVFLLSVSVIQGQNGWGVTYTSTEICAVKGSTVEIRCSYTYPSRMDFLDTKVEKAFWFIDNKDGVFVDLKTDSEYSGRVQYDCDKIKNDCTLRITDLRESDSAVYYFRFITNQKGGQYYGQPGVTLSVTDLKVSTSSSSSNLQCQSSKHQTGHTFYIWYKNGQKIQEDTSPYVHFSYGSADSYSCAVKGCGGFPSPSVYAPKLPSVSVSPSAEIVEGRSVTLTCSSDANPAANYTWYKENEDLRPLSEEPQLVFNSIQSSDSGDYNCTAENELGRRTSDYISIDVKYAPKLPSVSVSPSAEIVEGGSVTLTCSSDANPAATYTWYKENENLRPLSEEPQLIFSSIQTSDSGQYSCTAENELGRRTSDYISIDVKYAPKLPSVSVSPSAEIVEGSSVNLTCSSDANPAATYTWYKENEVSQKASGQIFNITDFRAEHSGNYYCEAQNTRGRHNSTLHLIVLAGSGKFVAAVTFTVLLLAVALIAVFLWIRKKRASRNSPEPEERADNREQRQPEEQGDLQYASIRFPNNQAHPLYYNIRPAQPLRHTEQEDDVEYVTVSFNSARAAPRPRGWGGGEDPATLYSTVNKTR